MRKRRYWWPRSLFGLMGLSVFSLPRIVRMLMQLVHPRTMRIYMRAGKLMEVARRAGGCVTLPTGALPGVKNRPSYGRDVLVRRNTEGTRESDLLRSRRFGAGLLLRWREARDNGVGGGVLSVGYTRPGGHIRITTDWPRTWNFSNKRGMRETRSANGTPLARPHGPPLKLSGPREA